MWFDTHCHPYFKPFNADREEVVQRALDAGVSRMLLVGCDHETNRAALGMAEQYDFMWATLGVHPCDCAQLDEAELAWIKEEAQRNAKVVAIGEMGLDYHHMKFSKEVQEDVFRAQIRLAKELDMPCIVHSRDAAEETFRILEEEDAEKVIFHCFSYGPEFGKRVWEKGWHTSFSGVVTYPQAKEIQEAARIAPLDLILVETDCPYLAPQSVRGKRNEMAYVVEVGEMIAKLRGVPVDHLARQTSLNGTRLLGLPDAA